MKDLMETPPLCVGNEADVRAYLALEVPPYYVYILQRPDGVPFYVGEGVKTRVLEHALTARRGHRIGESNPHKCNVIRKIEKAGGTVRYAIMSTHQTKIEAQREEGRLIAAIGRACENGTLTNLHPGRETGLGMHPETEARRAATLSYDPKNLPEDMETRALHELMHSVVPVNSNPLKPRSRYQGTKVRHTTGTTKSRQPKPRSAGALATLASLTAGSIVEGTLLPRAFLYDGIPAILENGVANDLVGTQVIEVIPASDPSDERFRITSTGTRALQDILGAELLTTLGLET